MRPSQLAQQEHKWLVPGTSGDLTYNRMAKSITRMDAQCLTGAMNSLVAATLLSADTRAWVAAIFDDPAVV
jgi:hypothetical protein